MIWTIKVELLLGLYAEEECIRVFEMDSSSTLSDLHIAIQDAVEFDNDHLFMFYIASTYRNRDRITFDMENGNVYDVTLEDIFPLPQGMKLFYLFDFGDEWLFKISKSRKKPQEPKKGVKYPRIIKSIGENPPQYPIWDDEE